jgi:GNAT superfamily N-acetyltransferase
VRPADLTPATSRFLLREGFAPRGQLCYLARRPAAVPATAGSVERLAPSRADEFLDLLALQGVDFPPERRDAKRGYYSTDRFQAFVARGADGAAHGWATMFVSDGSAFFGNSYTLPAFRKRGAHGSLLAARLTAASDLGLEIAFTDVEHRSASHDNCERAGFRTLTINTIWSRGPGA